MDSRSARPKLPETTEDQMFLLETPDDLRPATHLLDELMTPKMRSGNLSGIDMIAAIKVALRMPDSYSKGSAFVICNAVREAVELCGFPSPEMIIRLLADRRRKLRETLKTK